MQRSKVKIHEFYILVCLLFFLIGTSPSYSQQDKIITYSEGMSIREIAREHLNDANLWIEILKVNNLSDLTELKPGMKLKIPSKTVIAAEKGLTKSLGKIREATKAGAKVLAPGLILNAVRFRDQAISARKNGEWQESVALSEKAFEEAQKALDESISRNDVAVEAVLNDKRGDVEGKKETDLTWKEAPLFSRFVEKEKVRTLSVSTAEIVFRDDSRLRLNENSQAVIQKMRKNIIENKQESVVSLVEGDIYAILSGSPKKKMDIDVPGVITDIKSKNFWINKDKGEVKVANYEGEIALTSAGKTIVLEKNKGSSVLFNRKPAAPKELLPPPSLSLPRHNSIAFKSVKNKSIEFKWTSIKDASGYWIEIAYESSDFHEIIESKWMVKSNEYTTEELNIDGAYYWRVAAIDKYGFPGRKSEQLLVNVTSDFNIPFVTVSNPREGELLQTDSVFVTGETERKAILKINKENVPVGDNGEFKHLVVLKEGENKLDFYIEDPAGNINQFARYASYIAKKDITIETDSSLSGDKENGFKSSSNGFTFSGKTDPDSRIDISSKSDNFRANTYSNIENGKFTINLPLLREHNKFDVMIKTKAGYTAEQKFEVERDINPPVIKIKKQIPDKTASKQYVLEGIISDGYKLVINDEDISLTADHFVKNLDFEYGSNLIKINAEDNVGNVSSYEKEVIFDNKPPKVSKHNLKKVNVKNGGLIDVTIDVEDIAGLKRAAKTVLVIGKESFTGYLKLNRMLNKYEGTITIPSNISGKVSSYTVELEDVLGNNTKFEY